MPELTLRERRPEDDFTFWHWFHGEENPEWQRWDGPYFPKNQQPMSWEDFQRRQQEKPPQPNPNHQIIALDGQCIGTVTRYEEDPAGGGWWELGIIIFDPAHWGSGYGRQALKLWTDLTFAETDVHVITLTTWSGNERMVRSAQHALYRECARIPEARLWDGKRWDSVRLAVLRRDWEARNPG